MPTSTGPTTVTLTGRHASYMTSVGGVTITGGDGDFRITATGDLTTIDLGNGSAWISASGIGDTITIGNTSGFGFNWIDNSGGSATITGGNGTFLVDASGDQNAITLGDGFDVVYATGSFNHIQVGTAAGTHDVNLVVSGGSSTVAMGAGNNTVYDAGDLNTITTGDGVQNIVATGSLNLIAIGNTPGATGCGPGLAHDGGFGTDVGPHAAGSAIKTGDRALVIAGDGNTSVSASGGGDYVQLGTGDDTVVLLDGTNAGFNFVQVGNGNNMIFLTGQYNAVLDGSGTDHIVGGTGYDTFVMNSAGGSDTIANFQATDQLDLSFLLGGQGLALSVDGLAANVSVMEQADPSRGNGAVDTQLTVTGSTGTAHVTLQNYDTGGLAGLLAQNALKIG